MVPHWVPGLLLAAVGPHFGQNPTVIVIGQFCIWPEWRLTVIAATVRIALVDILVLSEVDIPAGEFLHPAVGWG